MMHRLNPCDLEYEMRFLDKHGLLPEQAIDRIAELEDQITEIPTLCRRYEADCQEKQKFMDMWASRAGKAEAKVAELEGTYARWKADWVDIDKTREAKIAELEAELKLQDELHKAICALEGSEGMTNAKFVAWVLAALKPKEGE